jgi:hypothetical protein
VGINKLIRKISVIPISVLCYAVSAISLVLPWSIRKKYLYLLGILGGIALKSEWVMQFVREHAFAQESEEELILKEG